MFLRFHRVGCLWFFWIGLDLDFRLDRIWIWFFFRIWINVGVGLDLVFGFSFGLDFRFFRIGCLCLLLYPCVALTLQDYDAYFVCKSILIPHFHNYVFMLISHDMSYVVFTFCCEKSRDLR